MRNNNKVLGKPEVAFAGTKAVVEALSGSPGMVAYATDTGAVGIRGASAWIWDLRQFSINMVIGNGLAVITSGSCGYIEVAFAGLITSVELLADTSGSCVIDIWKDTYANYPPTDADSITSATPPSLVGAAKSTNSTLTNWTKTIAAGDILGFNVDSCNTIKQVTLCIRGTKT